MIKPQSEFLEYILELLEPSGDITSCRMFGGYAIRKNNLPIALIFGD
jgi:TfoX/Sxy family transcriptional regulator of competence genes